MIDKATLFWMNNKTKDVYELDRYIKGKIGEEWVDGVIYISTKTGESFWRTEANFLEKFSPKEYNL